jgi:NADPH-dependent 2,4-dienoyl-CoA reductase/sulfur reductase-like enzyme
MIQNLIIGAGPAGLAIAGALRHAKKDFYLIEQSHHIASKWHAHYDRLHLHTIKEYSHLPFMPFPDEYPTYISKSDLIAYYESYAAHWDIKPHYHTKATKISKHDNEWHVHCEDELLVAKNVIVATGINRIPNIPHWKGQELFTGEIIHASQYKNATPYHHKRVLIIGMGNTGAEIALDLAEHNVQVGISIRSKLSIVPRDLFGRPIQKTAKILDKLPFDLGAHIGNIVRRLYFGNLAKYNVPIHPEPPIKMLRETGKTPTIDLGTVARIKDGSIHIHADVSHFDKNGVYFTNGDSAGIDAVILATGYLTQLDTLIDDSKNCIDLKGEPITKCNPGNQQGLYFIGFDNYKTGGILGTLRDDSAEITRSIAATGE